MKNVFRVLSIIALVAVIGFGLTACDDGSGTTGKTDPLVTWPTGLTATVGQTLSQISLPGNAGTAGTFTWTNPAAPVGEAGQRTHNMTFTPSDTAAYNTVQNNVTITVTGGNAPNTSLNGVWVYGNNVAEITVSGNSGMLTSFNSTSAGWTDAYNKGYINQWWRNLQGSGNLTWSGQQAWPQYSTNPDVCVGVSWPNITIVMSADGQTLTVSEKNANGIGDKWTQTYTRKSNTSLNGVWVYGNNVAEITVSGNSGMLTSFNSTSAGWTDAYNKGYINQWWRNLQSTGNLTWSGQQVWPQYSTNPDVCVGVSWPNITIVMSADGQTLTVSEKNENGIGDKWTQTYTRQ